jgi:dynein heavy chain
VADLNAKLAVLIADFDKAMNEKDTAMAEAAKCEKKLDLAQRLVGALGSELDRWS